MKDSRAYRVRSKVADDREGATALVVALPLIGQRLLDAAPLEGPGPMLPQRLGRVSHVRGKLAVVLEGRGKRAAPAKGQAIDESPVALAGCLGLELARAVQVVARPPELARRMVFR